MNLDDIRKINPCYDPTRYLPDDWEGDALDILRREGPAVDKIYVLCHPGWIDKRVLYEFTMWFLAQSGNQAYIDRYTPLRDDLTGFVELAAFMAARELAEKTDGDCQPMVDKLLEMVEP